MEAWPSILPAPTNAIPADNDSALVSTEMDSGRKRRRRRFTRELRTYKVSWELDDFQYGMFQAWFSNKISGGADEFTIALPTGGEGLKVVTAAFANGKYSQSQRPVFNWTISATLEVNDADVWTEEVYDALLISGDIDALEAAVEHVEEFVEN